MEKENKQKILIADGNNLGWMAFGITPLTFKGERVEAIYVGLNMIRSYLKEFNPNKFYLVWDGGRDAKRLHLYPEYKQRTKELTEDEFQERSKFFGQLKKLQDVMKLLGVVQYRVKGCEADDIIFNLLDKEAECVVVSTDKDFYQLLENDNVAVYNPVKKQMIRAKEVEEKYSIPVSYFIDYKSLMGDPSDNLPGVKGIGTKWATWLINNVLMEGAKYDELTSAQIRVVNLLFNGLKTFDLMKQLIRLKEIDSNRIEKGKFEDRPTAVAKLQERGVQICQEYGFESHQKSFPNFIRPFEMLWRKNENAKSG